MNKLAAAFLLLLAAAPARAADFSAIGNLAQDEFGKVARDLGAAFAYRGITPATPLGVVGFDIGLGASSTSVEHSDLFRRAGAGGHSELMLGRLHVHKGLPARFDLGAFVAASPDIDARLIGAELRYAFLDDGLSTPAVAVRLSGTWATGLGDLEVGTAAIDLMASKRFAVFTPYAGAGYVRVNASAGGTGLADEKFNQGRFFAGVNLNLLAVNLALEGEKMGDNATYAVKVGFRF